MSCIPCERVTLPTLSILPVTVTTASGASDIIYSLFKTSILPFCTEFEPSSGQVFVYNWQVLPADGGFITVPAINIPVFDLQGAAFVAPWPGEFVWQISVSVSNAPSGVPLALQLRIPGRISIQSNTVNGPSGTLRLDTSRVRMRQGERAFLYLLAISGQRFNICFDSGTWQGQGTFDPTVADCPRQQSMLQSVQWQHPTCF